MNPRRPANIPASIRARLYNLAKKDNTDFTLLLTAFATERFLYRLGKSEFADRFVLKGARLFALWSNNPFRATRDLDLLGYGEPSVAVLRDAIQTICRMSYDADGVVFDHASARIEEIRTENQYDGQRVRVTAYLDNARIPLQIDVAFGDVVTPAPLLADYSPLLPSLHAPRIRVYPRETVVAEKLHAMVTLGEQNTRMKDFFDICLLVRNFGFDSDTLCRAIRATFDRRSTPVPTELPESLDPAFAIRSNTLDLWTSFLARVGIARTSRNEFAAIQDDLRRFLAVPLQAAARQADVGMAWDVNSGWRPK